LPTASRPGSDHLLAGLVALFVDGDAYLANAGDSRAVLAHACTDEEARKDGREKLSVTQVETLNPKP